MQKIEDFNYQKRLSYVNIRPLVRSDLPQLEWDGEFVHLRKVYARAFERVLEGKSIMWVADLPGQGIIGQVFIQYVSIRSDLADGINRAYLYAFRIKPVYRNAGLGTRMNQVLETHLLNKSFREISLIVAKENTAAIRLYERLGYKKEGQESGEWSFRDHRDRLLHVVEPGWKMVKVLRNTSSDNKNGI
jgi:ribosomal protein S18 acetylase RimI-like enzyme